MLYQVQGDFFKVLHGHIKAPKWHLKGPLATLVAAMGKCKQINNSNLPYMSDVISLIIDERIYVILLMPCFLP